MRSVRPLLDRHAPFALVSLAAFTALAATASCASDREAPATETELDGGAEAAPADAAPDTDAGAPEAGPFRGGLREVECTSPPCAVALTAAREESFCALLQDRTVACWGANAEGQLGRGDTSTGNATPARVSGLSGIAALDRTCAVDREGAAFCWGSGPFGGDGGAASAPTPVRLDLPAVKKVSAHRRTACALTHDEGVLCWGANEHGQLGAAVAIDKNALHPPTALALGPGAPLRDISVNEATFVVRDDGTSVSWGANTLVARESSLSPDPYPRPTTFARIEAVDVADERACAAASGDAFCWGKDVGPEPFPWPLPEPIVQIATTKSLVVPNNPTRSKPARWCATTATGAVYCWGNNAAGQAGDGTKNHAARPVQVLGLPGPAARVKTTYEATCVLLVSGKIYCVGNNYFGQLGDGQLRTSSLVPVEVKLP